MGKWVAGITVLRGEEGNISSVCVCACVCACVCMCMHVRTGMCAVHASMCISPGQGCGSWAAHSSVSMPVQCGILMGTRVVACNLRMLSRSHAVRMYESEVLTNAINTREMYVALASPYVHMNSVRKQTDREICTYVCTYTHPHPSPHPPTHQVCCMRLQLVSS